MLSRDVTFDIPTLQSAWPKFEAALDSLRGRSMMGVIYADDNIYRLAASKLGRDTDSAYGLSETVVPGGDYMRLTLRGEPPALYESIAGAFDSIFEQADRDPGRPAIEVYRRRDEVDCLVPVL